jgi:hypothetical protein
VLDLLEKNLSGTNDDEVKLETMDTLEECFKLSVGESLDERQEKAEYMRAVAESNGCHSFWLCFDRSSTTPSILAVPYDVEQHR